MFGPYIALEMPPRSFFNFPPEPLPAALPPPSDESTFKSPFPINAKTYNAALDGRLPLTFAVVYITCVTIMNQINRKRGYKPYGISKSDIFKGLVLLHNALLAVYSGITCAAMIRALNVSLSGSTDKYGLPGTLDALCKIQGPRGIGDAVTYDISTNTWGSRNSLIHLGEDLLTPDATDVGRIWNEGLAFWGWFFYLSKFYEVVDTMIILAKGKRSSTLQTYHHAGAMLCMWAGMRYMSPPIWMFVLVNSGIHTMMYTYYSLAGIGVKVPGAVKRTLTTMQILQFLVGASFAAAHLFVSYTVPVSVPYTFVALASELPSAVSSAAASVTSLVQEIDPTSTLSSLVAEATSDGGAWLKKLIYRAGGSPALAENVRNHNRQTFGESLRHKDLVNNDLKREITEIRYHNEWHEVHCLDTNGQAFAIWLNVLYLAPLTILFLRFFWKTYVSGSRYHGSASKKGRGEYRQLSDSVKAAAGMTSSTFEKMGSSVEHQVDPVSTEVTKAGKEIKREAKDFKFNEKYENLKRDMEKLSEQFKGRAQEASSKLQAKGEAASKDVGEKVEEQESSLEDVSKDAGEKAQDAGAKANDAGKKVKEAAEQVKEQAKGVKDEAKENVQVKKEEQEGDAPETPAKQNGNGSHGTPGGGKKHKSPKKKH